MTEENKKFEFEAGEYAEGMPWQIVTGEVTVQLDGTANRCKHIKRTYRKKYERYDGGSFEYEYGVLDAVVQAINEAGHNCTHVCLLCILEGAIKAGILQETKDEKEA